MNIYMIGICGVAMGSLACMLRDAGHKVAGSDKEIFPPMSDVLLNAGIRLDENYVPSDMGSPDLVIIGNAISRGNPQVEHTLNENLPYCSMPAALWRFFLHDKDVIAVAGTHGKTTTTALLSHILISAGYDPGCFIGGVTKNYDSNYRIGGGKYFVIEADEYDSAFFEKIPKFMSYRPRRLIMTSLEFDHADIYSDLSEIELWFKRLVNIVPSGGDVAYCARYPQLAKIAAKSFAPVFSFGTDEAADIFCRFSGYKDDNTEFILSSSLTGALSCSTSLFGGFNLENIAAASSMAIKLGVDAGAIVSALSTFRGVKRRQELIFSSPHVKVYEDFAHHPTAIKAVLEAIRQRYPDSKIYAVYEPRSATSRRNLLQEETSSAFQNADEVFIKTPFNIAAIPETERIDIEYVVGRINTGKTSALLFDNVDAIIDALCAKTGSSKEQCVIVIMSNGGFGGIYEKIVKRLETL
ncbi:MAG: Mur ligase family protein [Leptospirales bacterium]|nr:Mur ligase family protein [Leptospirales bacterium]